MEEFLRDNRVERVRIMEIVDGLEVTVSVSIIKPCEMDKGAYQVVHTFEEPASLCGVVALPSQLYNQVLLSRY